MSFRRVVVTGLGLVTPLSTGVKYSWQKLINNESGIITLKSDNVKREDSASGQDNAQALPYHEIAKGIFNDLPATVAGVVKPGNYEVGGFNPKEWLDRGDERKMALFTQYAICAAKQAIMDAEWAPTSDFEKDRTDLALEVSRMSSLQLIPLILKTKSLVTKYNDRPEEASRPFDRDRDGFVMSEGAGIVVLEEYNHARNRGARIYAEIRGYGLSAPPESGIGAELAMRRALEHAHLSSGNIDYINAHATSTPLGDIAENKAIKSIFGNLIRDGYTESSKKLAISSTKGSIGHLLGAAGSVEAIFTILAIKNNILPPTLNLHNPGDPSTDFAFFNYVPQTAQHHSGIRAALTNSFGFGGTNASLCFAKCEG
ncbi:16385_t:CDS:2 [Acaulospora colombiana]|uniref:16385_t:CDS:1 n=1 Tax=Acaulospora colombiana TaxID=27376 RepID=A0ACA9KEM4_9GLOM|nr:16385_t:CDS:2 [Acaulospora colombiana]